jgi:AdoMet-dependent heme synthase
VLAQVQPSRSRWAAEAPLVLDEPGTYLPHVVAWNLTRRCNLACAHCYISAGSWHGAAGELSTDACLAILDQILDVNPNPMLILSGGEPLLREDLETIAQRASARGATVVVGTNGTLLTDARIDSLMAAGITGVAVSIDSLDPRYHDRFRNAASHEGEGPPHDDALASTLAAVDRCRAHGLDFVIQTTVTKGNRHELADIAAWAAEKGAVSFNVYFLVATGRAEGMHGLTSSENDETLKELVLLEHLYRGRMMVRSKCQPQIMRHAFEADAAARADGAATSPFADSSLLNYATRCPCAVHYCRITPEGKLTPCPYSPEVAGDLRRTAFRDVWESSAVLIALRHGELKGRCGKCEYRQVCGGCRARAQAETGDLLGEDPSCAYEPTGDEPLVQPRRGITYGAAPSAPTLAWTPEARAKIDKVPSFVRGVVSERVEKFAKERGYARVDLEVMAEVRRAMPVDFSKRLPFFLGKGHD